MPYYSLETIHEVAKDENKIFLSKIYCQDSSRNHDDIYIKLKLTSEYKVVISVGSFHLSR